MAIDDHIHLHSPSLTPERRAFLLASLTDYCLSHGIIHRHHSAASDNYSHLTHAPVTLFPSPFPQDEFEKAIKLQTTYNLLYARIASDVEGLQGIMDKYILWFPLFSSEHSIARVDDFIKQLWELYYELRQQGFVQVRT